MDVDKEFAAMAEQLTEDAYWNLRIHKDTVRLYALYLMGILVGLFLARKGPHVR